MRITYAAISKRNHLSSEDRHIVHQDILYAVSDGAGGTGILCEEWAAYLLDHLPSKPFIDFNHFILWLEPLAETFVSKNEQLLQNDNHQLKRFYQEGSAATLAVLWETPNEIFWLSYGDSLLVYQDSNGQIESHPFQDPEQFSGGTYLLNWMNLPQESAFQMGRFPKTKGAHYYLATDAIGKHLLSLLQTSPNEVVNLQEALESEKIFRKYILDHPTIEEDDYTLIHIHNI